MHDGKMRLGIEIRSSARSIWRLSMHRNAAAVSGDTNANDIVEIHRFIAMIGDLNDKLTTLKECKGERFKP